MEEASIAFEVQGAEEEGSDEEEELQRKEELHQLLTEQLQDDLLDDSVSTTTTENGAADSTLLGEEVGVSMDHVISLKSCDLSPAGGKHLASEVHSDGQSSALSASLVGVSGCGQGGWGHNVGGQTEVSTDEFSGTAQAYSIINPDTHMPPLQPDLESHTHQEKMSLPEGRGQLEVLYGARCRQVDELTRQLQLAREEREKMERILRHEKVEVEMRERREKEELQREMESLSQQLRETSAALETARAETEEVCAMLHPPTDNESGDVAQRLIEVSAEKEDLQYQLSCCQGQLESQTRKAETSEEELSRMSSQLLSLETEVERLGAEVTRLKMEGEREREGFGAEKREALEKCRAACLQLHEDATERLRDAMTAEKETLLLEHRHQLTSLQDQLSSVQEEYVKLSGEKEMMVATHRNAIKQAEEEWQTKMEQLLLTTREKEREKEGDEVRQAVERAREEWRQTLALESRQSVEKALLSARQQWQARLTAEKEAVKREAVDERETAIRVAVEATHSQWHAEHQHTIQAAVEKARREWEAEPVLTAAQVHSMIQTTVATVKKDVRQMLGEVVRMGREREEQAVSQCRLATAQEMKSHYLSCLHMMVNSSSGPPVATEPKASVEHGTDTGRKATQAAVVGTNRNKRAAGSARGGRGGKRVAGATQGQRSRK